MPQNAEQYHGIFHQKSMVLKNIMIKTDNDQNIMIERNKTLR